MPTVNVAPSDSFPGCTQLTVTPDVPGYVTQERLLELFDYRDGDLIWKVSTSNRALVGSVAGFLGKNGKQTRRQIRVDGRLYLAHRLVFFWHHGWMPKFIDHRDRDATNNRIENLRPATTSQNLANVVRKAGSSQFKGVSWQQDRGKWFAKITVNTKQIPLGRYDNEEDAARAYNTAAIEHFGEFAVLNEV